MSTVNFSEASQGFVSLAIKQESSKGSKKRVREIGVEKTNKEAVELLAAETFSKQNTENSELINFKCPRKSRFTQSSPKYVRKIIPLKNSSDKLDTKFKKQTEDLVKVRQQKRILQGMVKTAKRELRQLGTDYERLADQNKILINEKLSADYAVMSSVYQYQVLFNEKTQLSTQLQIEKTQNCYLLAQYQTVQANNLNNVSVSNLAELEKLKIEKVTHLAEIEFLKSLSVINLAEIAQLKREKANNLAEIGQLKREKANNLAEIDYLKKDSVSKLAEIGQLKNEKINNLEEISALNSSLSALLKDDKGIGSLT